MTLPSVRIRHRAAKINARGRVSALCFKTPKGINMKQASWTLSDEGTTCSKCRKLMNLAPLEE